MARDFKDLTIRELVSMIETGQMRLPVMQRRYVWSKNRVRDLLDSLYRDYPSGNILAWDCYGRSDSVHTRDFAISQSHDINQFQLLLLDGQQRLTSLSAILRGEPVMVRRRKRPIEILFNLEHPDAVEVVTEVEEDSDVDPMDDATVDATTDELQRQLDSMVFAVENKRLAALPHWVRVSSIFRASNTIDILKRLNHTDLNDPSTERYFRRLERVRQIADYKYRVDFLNRSLTYEDVTEIFVRVNSLGVKLRGSDLALAQITAIWPEFSNQLDEYREECERTIGYNLDQGVHVRNLVSFASGQSRFKVVPTLSSDALSRSWDDAKSGMNFALHLLYHNFSIKSPDVLSSPFIVLVVAAFASKNGYQLTPSEEALLRRWTFLANAKGRFSRGSSETILDEDLRTVNDLHGTESLTELLQVLERQVGRLTFEASDFEGRNRRSSLFRAMRLLFQSLGATDWHDGLKITSTRSSRQSLQSHHIFPKKVLKVKYTNREINDLCNYALLSGQTNVKISADEPSDYLPNIVRTHGVSILERQCVPTEPALWTIEAYPAFIAERRKLLATAFNQQTAT